ncbi:UbiD family decarboxylase [bacterium]|nr:MAG: UbiD family decarboxylase [bacterium]
MAVENFRSWIETWEKKGWLTRVRKPVEARYTLGGITRKLGKEKAVLFEQVSGYATPLATNFIFSREALAASLGMEEEDLILRFQSAMEKPHPCEVMEKAHFQENVLTRQLNPLKLFPIPTYHERDAGPYITGGILVVKDPETGIRNASIHRIRVFEDGVMSLLILPRHLDLCLQKFIRMKRPLEVAVAIGVDPFTLLSSQAILPFGVDELEVANAMREGSPLKLARCATVDLEVPVDSEIVLEGVIDTFDTRVEGPFGEFPRYYSPAAARPTFKLSAICHRDKPVYYSILPAAREHLLLGAIPREASILTDIQRAVPSVKAVHLTYGGTCRYHLIISLTKRNEGEARTAMLAAMVNNADIKHVVVVDEDIDIFDMEQVEWALATRFQGDRDLVVIPQIQISTLDPSSAAGLGTKMGMDATAPVGSLEHAFKPITIPGYEKIDVKGYL